MLVFRRALALHHLHLLGLYLLLGLFFVLWTFTCASCSCPQHLRLYFFLLVFVMSSDSEVVLVPDMVEYATGEDGMKRVGFIEGEQPKMTPLPEDKAREKEEEEQAIKAMESLNLQDEAPKEDGDPGEKEKEDEDDDNGADFDLYVVSLVVHGDSDSAAPAPAKPLPIAPTTSFFSQGQPIASPPKPALVHGNGSRFVLDAPPQAGFTRMGWLDPVTAFGKLMSAELVHYACPYVNMMANSRTRPEWHNLFCNNAALREWLFASEEHAFYLFAIKVLATLVMQKPTILKPCDREMVLVMERVHSSDLAEEMRFIKTFRYHNDISIYVAAMISHVRSVIDLRVPLPDGYTFHRAPAWNKIPLKGMAPILFEMPSK